MASVVRWLKSGQSQAIELSPMRKQNDVAEDSGDEFDHEMENVSNVSLKHTEGKLINRVIRHHISKGPSQYPVTSMALESGWDFFCVQVV